MSQGQHHPAPGGPRRGGPPPLPPVRRQRDYPVAIPVAPPPGWPQPAAPPPARPSSAFQRDLGLVLTAAVVLAVVFTCSTAGWLWAQWRTSSSRPRPAQTVVRAPAPPPPAPVATPAPPPRPTPAPRPPADPPRPAIPPPVSPPAAPAGLTFERDVRPILAARCFSCHGAMKKRGGLDLRTLAALRRGGDTGPGVQPGDPADSPLWESIASNRMPPGRAKLSAAEKRIVRAWVAGGAR